MVVHAKTFGPIYVVHLIIVQIMLITVHVLLVEGMHLLPLSELTITVNQELLMLKIFLPIASMTHCGTDLVASLVTVVIPLPNHGFIVS